MHDCSAPDFVPAVLLQCAPAPINPDAIPAGAFQPCGIHATERHHLSRALLMILLYTLQDACAPVSA
jgi:hypothetical protein